MHKASCCSSAKGRSWRSLSTPLVSQWRATPRRWPKAFRCNRREQMGTFSVAETGALVYQTPEVGPGGFDGSIVRASRSERSVSSAVYTTLSRSRRMGRARLSLSIRRLVEAPTSGSSTWLVASRCNSRRIRQLMSRRFGLRTGVASCSPRTGTESTVFTKERPAAREPMSGCRSNSGLRPAGLPIAGSLSIQPALWREETSGSCRSRPTTSRLNCWTSCLDEWQAQFSPDGRWIAFTSNEFGGSEVYAMPFPGPGGRTRISTSGGSFPRWRRDGKELFFETGGSLHGHAVIRPPSPVSTLVRFARCSRFARLALVADPGTSPPMGSTFSSWRTWTPRLFPSRSSSTGWQR